MYASFCRINKRPRILELENVVDALERRQYPTTFINDTQKCMRRGTGSASRVKTTSIASFPYVGVSYPVRRAVRPLGIQTVLSPVIPWDMCSRETPRPYTCGRSEPIRAGWYKSTMWGFRRDLHRSRQEKLDVAKATYNAFYDGTCWTLLDKSA